MGNNEKRPLFSEASTVAIAILAFMAFCVSAGVFSEYLQYRYGDGAKTQIQAEATTNESK